MSHGTNKYAHPRAAVLLLLLATGCSTIVRENILSSVNTVVGASVAENPQSGLYEAKAGYVRSQFYSIPTGKTILYSTTTNIITDSSGHSITNLVQGVHPSTTNAANITPNLVSGVKVKTDARHLLLGIDIAESFVVGTEAVNSPAAVAMFISQSDSVAANAPDAAARAVSSLSTNVPKTAGAAADGNH